MGTNGGFFDETLDVAKIYAYNETKIAAGGNVEPDAFESPTKDDEVRFFDVGEKEVVRLRFAAPTAETTAPTLGAPAILRERRNGFLARESAFRRFRVLLGASRRRLIRRSIFSAAARAGRVGQERKGAARVKRKKRGDWEKSGNRRSRANRGRTEKRANREKAADALAETVEAAVEQVEERAGETLGEAVGDWVGEAAGEAVGAAVGETAGELIGAAAGPVGALAGGLVGLAAGKALDAAFRPEKPEETVKTGDSAEPERTGPASRRKIARSVASLAVSEADALGFDVEKLRTALKFWKEASSATAALSGVGRWVAAEAEAGCERLREAFAGDESDESEKRREEREIRAKKEIKKKSERQDNEE